MSLPPEILPAWWYETDRERLIRRAEDAGEDCLVRACLQCPERAAALQKALAKKPEPKPYQPPVWAHAED